MKRTFTEYPAAARCRNCGHPFDEHARQGGRIDLNVCTHGNSDAAKAARIVGCKCRSFLNGGPPK